MQVQFGLGQRRLRLFQTGFGLGNLLRAVTGAILTQLILRRFERCLRLIARGAGILQIVGGNGAAGAQPELALIKVLRIVVSGLRLFHRRRGLGNLFRAVAGHHQVILRLGGGDIGLGLQQGIFIRRAVKLAESLPGADVVAFVDGQRGQPTANAEAHVDGADIDIAIQGQRLLPAALVPPPAAAQRGEKNHDQQNDDDGFFHQPKLLCDNPCRMKSI